MLPVSRQGDFLVPLRIRTCRIAQPDSGVQLNTSRLGTTAGYTPRVCLLSQEQTVLLAHPSKLRPVIQRRAKADRLDCQVLANLLRIDHIPEVA
jgi:hypothetical protein